MVKPPLRTKSIGFKVSEEEYARLETAAQASGRTLGEWCREVILRGGASYDPALAETAGVRLLLVNGVAALSGPDLLPIRSLEGWRSARKTSEERCRNLGTSSVQVSERKNSFSGS